MKKMTKAMLMTALILGSVSMGTAVEANELNTFALDEYVVTATRTLKELQEVPASVSVITAQDIEKKNATSLRQALKGLPGVFIDPTSISKMNNGIEMRGFSENNILILVDGAQINTAYKGVADLNSIPVENIERIEVLRGAASSIYGGYAVGGVINITTKEAKNIGTHGEAVVTYGSNDTWKKSLQVNSKVNDKWSFGLGYEKSESDGYVDSYITKEVSTKSSNVAGIGYEVPKLKQLDNGHYLIGERGKRSWEDENYNFNVKYNFDDSKSLKYAYSKTEYETHYGVGNLYVDTSYFTEKGAINLGSQSQGAKVGPRDVFGTDNYFERDTHGITYNDINNNFKVQATYIDNKVDGFSQPASNWNSGDGIDFEYLGKGDYTAHPSKIYNVDVEKAWENIGKHTIVAGLNYKKEEMNQTKYGLDNWRNSNNKGDITNIDKGAVENFAFYLQDEYKINDPLTLYVGARVDYYKKGGGTFINYSDDNPVNTSPSESYVEVSPKIALDYKADEKTNYYVSYSHAFNPPEMYKLYRRSINTSTKSLISPNPALEPETSDMFEIGLKKEISPDTKLGLTFYHIETTDKISSDPIEYGQYWNEDHQDYYPMKEYRNVGEETRHGIELELNHKFSDKYSAYLNYAWQQGDIAVSDPVDNTDIPTHLLHAGVEYNCDKWNALLECQYISERNVAEANDWEGMGSREAVFLVNTAFNYEIQKDMTLQFGINNLFDKIYYCDEPIDGRTYYVGLRYKF